MPTHDDSGAAYEPELSPDSPVQAEELVAAGVPIEAVPGLGPNEKAILRLALNAHSGSAPAAAKLLAELRNVNIQANVPAWLRAEAVRSIVAHSRVALVCPLCSIGQISPALGEVGYSRGKYEWHCWREQACSFRGCPDYEPDPPNPFASSPKRFWLSEGGPVVIPSSGDGHRRVENGHPIQRLQDGTTIEFGIPPWLFQWKVYLLAYLPHAMRETFRVDDFRPPPMGAGAPGGLLSLEYTYREGGEASEFLDYRFDPLHGSTASAALLKVFLSELKLDAFERFIYLASQMARAKPKDLGLWLGISADAARMRQRRVLRTVAQKAEESEALKLLDPDFIWQPQGCPGPYGHHRPEPHPNEHPEETRQRRLYQRFMAQRREWDDWSPERGLWHGLARVYGRSGAEELVRKVWADKGISANSALYRYGEGNSLDELRSVWAEPNFPRAWAPLGKASRGYPYSKATGESWGANKPLGESAPAPAPSREFRPRCLEPTCAHRAKELYESRALAPVNAETWPPWIPKPKERTDAHSYCTRHLRKREETMRVTQAEIADRLRGLEDLHGELRETMGQTLTALTWRFPDDEELLDAVDNFRRDALGQHGVTVLAKE